MRGIEIDYFSFENNMLALFNNTVAVLHFIPHVVVDERTDRYVMKNIQHEQTDRTESTESTKYHLIQAPIVDNLDERVFNCTHRQAADFNLHIDNLVRSLMPTKNMYNIKKLQFSVNTTRSKCSVSVVIEHITRTKHKVVAMNQMLQRAKNSTGMKQKTRPVLDLPTTTTTIYRPVLEKETQ